MKPWAVEIVRYSDEGIEHTIECASESRADLVDDGLQWNLDHERFFTRVVKREKKNDGQKKNDGRRG